jgi:hypothetical protein
MIASSDVRALIFASPANALRWRLGRSRMGVAATAGWLGRGLQVDVV